VTVTGFRGFFFLGRPYQNETTTDMTRQWV